MEAQSALVGADGAVELYAEAAVDAHLAAVVNPGDGKLYETLGLDKTLNYAVLLIFGVLLDDALEALENLQNRLVELALSGVAGQYRIIHTFEILISQHLQKPHFSTLWHCAFCSMSVSILNEKRTNCKSIRD